MELVVLEGVAGELRWQVGAGSVDGGQVMTTMNVIANDEIVGSAGFAGPILYPDRPMSEWSGEIAGLQFVMARVPADTTSIQLVLADGTKRPIGVSEPVEGKYRVAAAALGANETMVALEHGVNRASVPAPVRSPLGTGWIANEER